ncbi:MAG: hypothetical protein RLZ81_3288 [Pseudomonadota bacterium]|jgi:hypothetical protein
MQPKDRYMTAKKAGAPATPATPMTPQAAARIQSATARQQSGQVAKGSFAARAQSAAAKGGKR